MTEDEISQSKSSIPQDQKPAGLKENAEIKLKKPIRLPKEPSPRFEWLDQFRGIVIILFIIAAVTWELSGSFTAIGNDQYINVTLPVGATFLNHGWKWADVPPGWREKRGLCP